MLKLSGTEQDCTYGYNFKPSSKACSHGERVKEYIVKGGMKKDKKNLPSKKLLIKPKTLK